MKHLLLALATLCSLLTASATLNGDGYYRVKNYATGRYCYLTDDKGEMNLAATTFDVGAIQLWSGFERASSDAACIIYVKNVGGKAYNLEAQGTSTDKFVEVQLYIDKAPTNRDTYAAYGVKGGMRKFLGDTDLTSDPQGIASVEAEGERREWYIEPVGTADGNFFGVVPTVESGGRRFRPFYADFPISTLSSGMHIYVISRIEDRFAILKECTGTIPAGTPVLIECGAAAATGNRLNIGGTPTAVGDNKLGGIYFDNTTGKHWNRTRYDAKTMRVLGTDNDGKLAFVKGNLDYLPANQSYLKVWDGCPDNILVVTEAEYQTLRYEPTAIALSHSTTKRSVGDSNLTLTAYLTPRDARTGITWSSSNPSVATIDANGNVDCLAEGTTELSATTDNGLSAKCTLTVHPLPASVGISQAAMEMTVGENFTLTAQVNPANVLDNSIKWYSDNPPVASVDANGKVTALKAGIADVRARSWNGKEGVCRVTVKNPVVAATSVTLDHSSATLNTGSKLQLTATVLPVNATDKSLTWSSSKPDVASVSETGLVSGLKSGATTIRVYCGPLSASCIITVKEAYVEVSGIELNLSSLTLREGDQARLEANVYPADATEGGVTWSSDNTSVATVSGLGVVKGVKKGTAQIFANAGAFSTSCTVNVIEKEAEEVLPNSIYLDKQTLSLYRGEQTNVNATVNPSNATDKSVVWTSSDPDVATVDRNGNILATGKGRAMVQASTVNGLTASVEVNVTIKLERLTVTPDTYTAVAGTEFDLIPGVIPDDADMPLLAWASSDVWTVMVDQKGHCKILKEGTAEVTLSGSGLKATAVIAGITGVSELLDNSGRVAVYTIEGLKIMDAADADAIRSLPHGLYIINGRKVIL